MAGPRFLLLLAVATLTASFARANAPGRPEGAAKQLSLLVASLEEFKRDCGRYPLTSEGLLALTRRPAGVPAESWRGPYVHGSYFPDGITKDPWRGDWVYSRPGLHNTATFDVYSCGADGTTRSGGMDDDDFNNWDKSQRWREYYRSYSGAFEPDYRPFLIGVLVASTGSLVGFLTWRRFNK
jgi:general secretion pathway protein G